MKTRLLLVGLFGAALLFSCGHKSVATSNDAGAQGGGTGGGGDEDAGFDAGGGAGGGTGGGIGGGAGGGVGGGAGGGVGGGAGGGGGAQDAGPGPICLPPYCTVREFSSQSDSFAPYWLAAANAEDVWSSTFGAVLKRVHGAWISASPPGVGFNADFEGIWASAADAGDYSRVVVSSVALSKTFEREVDGGWTVIGDDAGFVSLAGLGDGAVLYGLSSGDNELVRYENGSWTPLGAMASQAQKLWPLGYDDVLVAGDQGVLQHYTDAGFSTVSAPLNGARVFTVWAADPSNVWAGTLNGLYSGTTSGLNAVTGFTGAATDIWGASPTNVFVLGQGGLQHFDGGSLDTVFPLANGYGPVAGSAAGHSVYSASKDDNGVYGIWRTSWP